MQDITIAEKYFVEITNLHAQTQNNLVCFFLQSHQIKDMHNKIIILAKYAFNLYMKLNNVHRAIECYQIKAHSECELELDMEYFYSMMIIGDLLNNSDSINYYWKSYKKAKKIKNEKVIFLIVIKIIKYYLTFHNPQEIIDFATTILDKYMDLFRMEQILHIKEYLANAYFEKQLYSESKNVIQELIEQYKLYPLKIRLCYSFVFKLILCCLSVGKIVDAVKEINFYEHTIYTFNLSYHSKFVKNIIHSIIDKNEEAYNQTMKNNINTIIYDDNVKFTLELIKCIYFD